MSDVWHDRWEEVSVAPAAVFFFNDTATTEIYTLSLHDALPISRAPPRAIRRRSGGSRGRTVAVEAGPGAALAAWRTRTAQAGLACFCPAGARTRRPSRAPAGEPNARDLRSGRGTAS